MILVIIISEIASIHSRTLWGAFTAMVVIFLCNPSCKASHGSYHESYNGSWCIDSGLT